MLTYLDSTDVQLVKDAAARYLETVSRYADPEAITDEVRSLIDSLDRAALVGTFTPDGDEEYLIYATGSRTMEAGHIMSLLHALCDYGYHQGLPREDVQARRALKLADQFADAPVIILEDDAEHTTAVIDLTSA